MKITLNRLKQLESGEISARIRKKIWQTRARRYSAHFVRKGKTGNFRSKSLDRISNSAYDDPSRECKFHFSGNERKKIQHIYDVRFNKEKKLLISKAEKYCLKQFTIFGIANNFNEGINWHLDPLSGQGWPVKFYGDICYSGRAKVGDIKLPWELNRHQHLVTLGQAYYLSERKEFAREVVSQITSWIKANPPFMGINWISGLEIGIRLINWIWAVHLIKESDALTPDFTNILLSSVEKQADYLYNNLSIGYYANNHLIGESAALAMAGIYFSGLKKAGGWVKKGIAVLEKESIRQIYSDGGGVEQANSYLRFILEFLVLTICLAKRNKTLLCPESLYRIEKAFEFLMLTLKPDGEGPAFGDSDNARALFLSSAEFWDFKGILALGAVLFNRGDFKWMAGDVSEEVLWITGPQGFKDYHRLAAETPQKMSHFLPESGYTVMRDKMGSDANYVLLDCGPLGYRTGAHGHADALSFQLVLSGEACLIDPGTYAYNQEPVFRDYFRSTKAHNTVAVDGKDQADINGRMSWSTIPTSKVDYVHFSEKFDLISAENNGYCRLAQPVTHRRLLIFCKDPVYILVIDKMITSGIHDFSLNYHFPPGAVLKCQDRLTTSISANTNILLAARASSKISCVIKEGDPEPMGWYSKSYGQKIESPSLVFNCPSAGQTLLYTLILPFRDSLPAVRKLEGHEKDDTIYVDYSCDDFSDQLIINPYSKKGARKNIYFRGETALIRRDVSGKLVSVYLIDSKKIVIDGQCYQESSDPYTGMVGAI